MPPTITDSVPCSAALRVRATGASAKWMPRALKRSCRSRARATVTVLKSSHDLFTNSVRSALSNMRFYPAEIGGRKVKQLVQQPFNFTLTR